MSDKGLNKPNRRKDLSQNSKKDYEEFDLSDDSSSLNDEFTLEEEIEFSLEDNTQNNSYSKSNSGKRFEDKNKENLNNSTDSSKNSDKPDNIDSELDKTDDSNNGIKDQSQNTNKDIKNDSDRDDSNLKNVQPEEKENDRENDSEKEDKGKKEDSEKKEKINDKEDSKNKEENKKKDTENPENQNQKPKSNDKDKKEDNLQNKEKSSEKNKPLNEQKPSGNRQNPTPPNRKNNFKPSAQKPANKPTPKTLKPENKNPVNKSGIANSFANRFNNKTQQLPGGEKAGESIQKAQKVKKLANTAKKVTKSAQAAVKTIIAFLTNPYTWIAIGIALVLVFAIVASFATVQTLGKNDLADGCYGIGNKGTTSLTFNEEDDMETRANKMATWLLEQPSWEVNDGKPLTKEQAFAIVGNFMAESNLEPKMIEQSAPNWKAHLDDNNEQIYTWTRDLTAKEINVGLGLAQWTWNPGRAESLINKAKETNTKWYEIQPQVELMKEEMDSPEYASELKRRGFTDEGKSEAELAIIFHDAYERSADNADMKARRGKYATETKEKYTKMGSTGGKTMGGSCTRNGSINTSDAVEFAKSIAWPPEQKANANTPSCECGREQAKPEYQDAKDALQENPETMDPHTEGNLFNSCDRVTVTVVKTMWDPDIPWGNVVAIGDYLEGKGKEKWEEVDIKDAQPGDVFISANNDAHPNHVAFYIGDYNGMDAVVEGSYRERVALISNAYAKDVSGFRAYRFVGDPIRSGLGKVSI